MCIHFFAHCLKKHKGNKRLQSFIIAMPPQILRTGNEYTRLATWSHCLLNKYMGTGSFGVVLTYLNHHQTQWFSSSSLDHWITDLCSFFLHLFFHGFWCGMVWCGMSVCVYIFACVCIHVWVCIDLCACGCQRLMSGSILHCLSTLFLESLSQTCHSCHIWPVFLKLWLCVCVWVHMIMEVPFEPRRGFWFTQDRNYRFLWAVGGGKHSGLLGGKHVLLTAETSLQILANLASSLALQMLCFCRLRLECKQPLHTHLAFKWASGDLYSSPYICLAANV